MFNTAKVMNINLDFDLLKHCGFTTEKGNVKIVIPSGFVCYILICNICLMTTHFRLGRSVF